MNDHPMDRSSGIMVRVLDSFELRIDGHPTVAPMNVQRVIAFLAVRDRPQPRRTMSSTIWMDTTDDRAASNLRTALWKVRRTLGDGLVADGGYVSLSTDVSVDFREMLQRARRLVREGAELSPNDEVAGLVGDLLPDWDEEWIMFERERYRQLRIHALEALCGMLVAVGRPGEAIEAGVTAVAAEPLRESAQRVLIAAHLSEGNLSEARRQYHAYRELLWDALGIEPSRALRALVGLASAVA